MLLLTQLLTQPRKTASLFNQYNSYRYCMLLLQHSSVLVNGISVIRDDILKKSEETRTAEPAGLSSRYFILKKQLYMIVFPVLFLLYFLLNDNSDLLSLFFAI